MQQVRMRVKGEESEEGEGPQQVMMRVKSPAYYYDLVTRPLNEEDKIPKSEEENQQDDDDDELEIHCILTHLLHHQRISED
ncbi:hypothetical protein QVD17_37458 [Tagetes erecta]|uniref:Uncharacterized protein n=1 Tax=Tagetes erecta TaxID=13708 RepID=A0AAD8JWR0_TARER|nr:hypothetical protein QVD17_37458 [Tagetes erecta]